MAIKDARITTSIRLPASVREKLDGYCRKHELSLTQAVERGLTLLFEQGDEPSDNDTQVKIAQIEQAVTELNKRVARLEKGANQ